MDKLPGESASAAVASADVWHLTSDRGEVRANGDDVELTGNVRIVGPAPGTGEPLSLTTESMRINTPTGVHRDQRTGETAVVGT